MFIARFDSCTSSGQNHEKFCQKTGKDYEFCHNRNNSKEASITWQEEDSLSIIKNQRKDNGKIQFKGIAVFNRIELDKFCKKTLEKYNHKICLSYERSPDANNPHHGNLLLKNVDNGSVRDMIISSLIHECFVGYYENDLQ